MACSNTIAGYYCKGGKTVPCPAGFECNPPNTQTPTKCPAGLYCKEGSNGFPCPEGHACPAGSAAPILCPPATAGRYYPAMKGTCVMQDCSAGTFCPAGTMVPSNCPKKYYCPAKSVVGTLYPCPAGSYCSGNSGAPTPCPPGSYCPATMQERPTPSPEGYFCPRSGMTACIQCADKSYCKPDLCYTTGCPGMK